MDLENFPTREMARDMMSMISPIYDRSYVGKWIFEVMSVALELARQTVDDLQMKPFRIRPHGRCLYGKRHMEYRQMRA